MRHWVGAVSVAAIAAVAGLTAQAPAAGRGVKVEISFPASVHAGPVTGRVYVMVSRTNDREPRLQIGRTGTPLFGRDVEKLAPGQSAIIDVSDLGTPVASLRDLPPGDYFVQGFVNIYSEVTRADGHGVAADGAAGPVQRHRRALGRDGGRGDQRARVARRQPSLHFDWANRRRRRRQGPPQRHRGQRDHVPRGRGRLISSLTRSR